MERLLGEGQTIAEAAKQVEISEQTYHRWRNQYGGMKADDAKRLRELERENARLKRIVADKELEIDALKEIGETKPVAPARGVHVATAQEPTHRSTQRRLRFALRKTPRPPLGTAGPGRTRGAKMQHEGLRVPVKRR